MSPKIAHNMLCTVKKKVPVSNFRGFSGVLSPILKWKTHFIKDLNLSWVMGLSAPPPKDGN